MKPFDIELAKQGRTVQTRNGKPARIICFDKKSENYPILALVESEKNCEDVCSYTNDGHLYKTNEETNLDLFMVGECKVGWVNMYYDEEFNSYSCGIVYKTEEEAVENSREVESDSNQYKYIKTFKIEWEE